MNLKEIAKLANVSVSTVSRVVNSGDKKSASKETRDKIWSIIKENGYVPNADAQKLKAKSKTIEVKQKKIYCVVARHVEEYIDPFFIELLTEIEYLIFNQKYAVRTLLYIQELEIRKFTDEDAGIIILGRINKHYMHIIEKNFKNIVYVGLNLMPFKIDQVYSSGYKASISAVDYLYANGHEKILYIGEKKDEQRYLGYNDAMEKHKLKPMIWETILTMDAGNECVKEIIKKKLSFTAILCASDDLAIGVISGFMRMKYKIPKEISVIGIDDIDKAKYMKPMLSTVAVPIKEMAKQAVNIIINRIEGKHILPIKVELDYEIIDRETIMKRKNKRN